MISHNNNQNKPCSAYLVQNTQYINIPPIKNWTRNSLHPAFGNTYILFEQGYGHTAVRHISHEGKILGELQLPNEIVNVCMFKEDEAILFSYTNYKPSCEITEWNLKTHATITINYQLCSMTSMAKFLYFPETSIFCVGQTYQPQPGENNKPQILCLKIACFKYPLQTQKDKPIIVIADKADPQLIKTRPVLTRLNNKNLIGWVGIYNESSHTLPVCIYNLTQIIQNQAVFSQKHTFSPSYDTQNISQVKIVDIWEMKPCILYLQCEVKKKIIVKPAVYSEGIPEEQKIVTESQCWDYNFCTNSTNPQMAKLPGLHRVQFINSIRNTEQIRDSLQDDGQKKKKKFITFYVDSETETILTQQTQRYSKPGGQKWQVCYPAYLPNYIFKYNLQTTEVKFIKPINLPDKLALKWDEYEESTARESRKSEIEDDL